MSTENTHLTKAYLESTPAQDGFHMPGEHHPHSSVWLIWPERPDNWRDNAKPAQATFARFITALSDYVDVNLAVSPECLNDAKQQLPESITLHPMKSNDAWMRDVGPTFVINDKGEKRAVDWHFNAWGGKLDGLYEDWSDDERIAKQVADAEKTAAYKAPFILEGGSIHSDGEGTVYTTEECLLHPSRNPELSKEQIEQHLFNYLGAQKVIWLKLGLVNDETNGHIDNILHIVGPGEVIITVCDDPEDPQYDISQAALKTLSSETDAQRRKIIVHKLPMPGPLYITEEEAKGIVQTPRMERCEGERLGASYANFLITNNALFFPMLDERYDEQAKKILQGAFPEHKIVGIPAREIVLGGGNLHCITQQVPKPQIDN
ncbi:agmatine deiminase [Marinomonas mediterranea]|uniref:agmatine deiminase n=1 Tax=Marinomonas mediterranea TaxID=119864 RepID=UPI0023495219|nr:agmatine deiminase [Marinomonas mediterranea]WCN10914.1 agmatine deiminase [Marinomonas mediterranea]